MFQLFLLLMIAFGSFTSKGLKSYILSLRSPSIQIRKQVLHQLEKELEELDRRRHWPIAEDAKEALQTWQKVRNSKALIQSIGRCLRYKPLQRTAFSCLAYLQANRYLPLIYQKLLRSKKKQKGLLSILLRYEKEATPYLLQLMIHRKWKDSNLVFPHLLQYPHPKTLPELKFLILKNIGKPRDIQKLILAYGKAFGWDFLFSWAKAKQAQLALPSLLILGRSKTKVGLNFLINEWNFFWRNQLKSSKGKEKSQKEMRGAILLQAIGESGMGDSFLIHLLQQEKKLPLSLKEAALFGLAFGKSQEGEAFLLHFSRQEIVKQEKTKKTNRLGPIALQSLGLRRCTSALDLALKALEFSGKWREKALFLLYRLGNKMGKKGWKALARLYEKASQEKEKKEILTAMRGYGGTEKIDFLLHHYSSSLTIALQNMIIDNLMSFSHPKVQTFMMKISQMPKDELYYKGWIYLRRYNPSLLVKALFQNLMHPQDWFALASLKHALEYPLQGLDITSKQKKRLLALAAQYPEEEELLYLLGYFKVPHSFSLLREVLEKKEMGQKGVALKSLARLSSVPSLTYLCSFIQHSKGFLHYQGIEALGYADSPKVVEILKKFRSSKDSQERRAAFIALLNHSVITHKKEKFFHQILQTSKMDDMELSILQKWIFSQKRRGINYALALLKKGKKWGKIGISFFYRFGKPIDWVRIQSLPPSAEKTKLEQYLQFLRESSWNPFSPEAKKIQSWFQNIKKDLKVNWKAYFDSHLFLWPSRTFIPTNKWLEKNGAFLKNLNLKELYITRLAKFRVFFGFSQKKYPSVLTGKELLLFHPQKGIFFIFKKYGNQWKLWGGG